MNASKGYQLIQRLSSGAWSDVYLAQSAGGRVAVREFKCGLDAGSIEYQRARARFLEAGRAAMGLKHPGIVAVLDVLDEGGDAFIVMEYEDSPTLESVLATRRYSAKQSTETLTHIAAALDFAHDRAVVHGDLKPSNIFVHPKHGVRVADFGISERTGWDSQGPVRETPMDEYSAPEHLTDPQSVSARSDQYSLAAIAYGMYTDQSVRTPTIAGPPGLPKTAPLTPPTVANRHLPLSINAVILRAMDPDPGRRYNSCREFTSALAAAFNISPETIPAARPNKTLYAAAAVILLLAASAFWFTRNRGQASGLDALSNDLHAARLDTVPAPPDPVVQASPAAAGKRTHSSTEAKAEKRKPAVPDAAQPPRPVAIAQTRPVMREAPAAAPVQAASVPARNIAAPISAPASAYTIQVFSRSHRIEDGSSFAFNDPTLGELGLGDLKVVVVPPGEPPAGGRFTLEWSVDGIAVASGPAALKQAVEYGNEPTAGSYRVTLKLDGRRVQSFSFRITP